MRGLVHTITLFNVALLIAVMLGIIPGFLPVHILGAVVSISCSIIVLVIPKNPRF